MGGRVRRFTPPAVDSTDYLVSVSDLMAGLLFIFILTLLVFALQLRYQEQEVRAEKETARLSKLAANRAENKVKKLKRDLAKLTAVKIREVARLQGVMAARSNLLTNLRKFLQESGLIVEIDLEHGVLRLPEGILFESGSDELREEGRAPLSELGRALLRFLPCLSESGPGTDECPDDPFNGLLDAIIVEGHTDEMPMRARERLRDNWDLGAARAIHAYKVLMERTPILGEFRNKEKSPVFGVAGYAATRPVDPSHTDEARSRNRRIDLRFLMSARQPDSESGMPDSKDGSIESEGEQK